jgi:hypothetical protein
MKITPIRKSEGLTLLELIVVIAVVLLFVVMLMPRRRVFTEPPSLRCINNLKQIGTAYRIWANNHGSHYPALQSVSDGGWRENLTNADQGFLCWTNYVIMANELGQFSKILICATDERDPVTIFANLASNLNVSYFVGVSASDYNPQSLLGGDRNLGAGTNADRDYGFSPENGRGNDVAIQTNSKAGPLCWSLKIHSAGNSAGAGYILLGDGSVQQTTSFNFRSVWQPNGGLTTNWPAGHVPSSPSYRVLFP